MIQNGVGDLTVSPVGLPLRFSSRNLAILELVGWLPTPVSGIATQHANKNDTVDETCDFPPFFSGGHAL
jgi:hypothetical protein